MFCFPKNFLPSLHQFLLFFLHFPPQIFMQIWPQHLANRIPLAKLNFFACLVAWLYLQLDIPKLAGSIRDIGNWKKKGWEIRKYHENRKNEKFDKIM